MINIRQLVITALYKSVIEADFKTVERKFLEQGIEKSLIKNVLDSFKELKNKHRIKKQEEKNIDWWGKKDFQELKDFVSELKETKSKTEETKIKKAEGAELKAENELWYVYKIISHESACFYGSKTKWCITEKDGKHFFYYSKTNDFYFFISKTRDYKDPLAKIAMNINGDGETVWWDASDKHLTSKDLTSLKNEFPEFKIDKVTDKINIDGILYALDNLPSKIKVNLDLSNTKITSLPEGLSVGGYLNLSRTKITSLPDGLRVGGYLNLSRTKITSLPDGLRVGGYLDLSRTKITSLPEDLKVDNNLYLIDTPITSLPEGLRVGGTLSLYGTKITSLPDGLSVGGDLYLSDTKITSLPKGLRVGGDLYLEGTKIKSLPKDLKVGGTIIGFEKES